MSGFGICGTAKSSVALPGRAVVPDRLPAGLAIALVLTDAGFLLYWALSALSAWHLIAVPAAWMYADYDKPWSVAWNWSFLPLDVAFSLSGLAAVAAARLGAAVWRPMALISLTLTVTAGLMADSYWVLMHQFDPAWFLSNLALVIWPLPYLAVLVGTMGCGSATRV